MTAVVAAFAPACMDADELALWRAEAGTETERRAATDLIPCHDCTLGYAAEMRAIGRCNGTPGGAEEDEPMETPEAAAVVEAAEIIGRRRITVVAPCPTCVHARVCRLRPADELDVRVSLPALADELDVTLAATVECAEYVRAPKARAAAAGTPGGWATASARQWNGGPLDRPKRTLSPEARERLRQGGLKTAARRAAARAEAAS